MPADGVLAPGAEVKRLAREFESTEGPTCDARGDLHTDSKGPYSVRTRTKGANTAK